MCIILLNLVSWPLSSVVSQFNYMLSKTKLCLVAVDVRQRQCLLLIVTEF